MITHIINGKILTPAGQWLEGHTLVINDCTISEILPAGEVSTRADKMIDAAGGSVIPGGIDMHVHGGAGHDFMDATEKAFTEAIAMHRRHGTTAILPSLAASSHEMMEEAARVCTLLMQSPRSGIVGLHYEGPYFQPSMAGGQIREYLRLPDRAEYERLVEEYPCIRRWDASPELPGAMEMGRFMRDHGVIAGLAHTIADAPIVNEAARNGYSLATHFYNAMTSVHKEGILKHGGTVEAIYINDAIDIEIISDGVHVPPTLLALAHKVKGADHIALMTDATSLTEAPADAVTDPRVIVRDGACVLVDGTALAGSCATMDRLIRTYVQQAGVPLAEVSRMASATPARLLGIDDKKGTLAPGKDADIIIFDKDLDLTHVIAMGEEVDGVGSV